VKPDDDRRRFGRHGNAFGFLRIVFASLVIVSHAPEIADGDRHREPLTMLFGSISLGTLAVYGFFIVSGYLITGSYVANPSVGRYLRRRVARIYPGFVVASLVCLAIVAPLGGETWPDLGPRRVATSAGRMLLLQPPASPRAFAGTHYPVLNGAMWTIAYEVRCYLLVIALGMAGLLRSPATIAALAATLLALAALIPPDLSAAGDPTLHYASLVFGSVEASLPLIAMFLSGMAFRLWRDRTRFTAAGATVAAALLVAGLAVPALATAAVATAGAYLILAVAQLGAGTPLAGINDRDDVSYGVYLYAFPIAKLLFWWFPALPLVANGVLTWIGAMLCGAASWFLVEKPAMRWAQARRAAPA
jgi:peptidoglycan/LPS O-acetylase OafA/YrhL